LLDEFHNVIVCKRECVSERVLAAAARVRLHLGAIAILDTERFEGKEKDFHVHPRRLECLPDCLTSLATIFPPASSAPDAGPTDIRYATCWQPIGTRPD